MSNSTERMVFQMRLSVTEKQELGWIFTTEEGELEQGQDFAYTVPSESNQDDWLQHSYRFPGVRLKEDAYQEFEAKRDGDFLVVVAGGQRVRFATLQDFSPPERVAPSPFPDSPFGPLPYIGRQDNLLGNFRLFLPIHAVDPGELDILYEQEKIVLVGLTPNFRRL